MMGRLDDIQNNLNAKAARLREQDAQRREDRRAAAPAPAVPDAGGPAAAPEIDVVSYKKLADYQKDARKRARDGWRVETHIEQERRVAMGRTFGKTILTGGAALVIGGRSKKGDAITITWIR
jgi:hypothetical protein